VVLIVLVVVVVVVGEEPVGGEFGVGNMRRASRIPYPERSSHPGERMSREAFSKMPLIFVGVRCGKAERTMAAMPAACGAAAEVPKNGLKPGVAVWIPSDARNSGFRRTRPPVVVKSFGVIGVLSEL